MRKNSNFNRSVASFAVLAASLTMAVACSGGSDETGSSGAESSTDGTSTSSSGSAATDATTGAAATGADADTDTSDGDESGSATQDGDESTTDGSNEGGAGAPDEAVPCEFDNAELLPIKPVCYRVPVPEDWSNPDPDDQVVLQVAVFTEPELAGSADPVVYFDGGPGSDTLDSLVYSFDSLVTPYVASRDVIVFDQRGVGTSNPSLACDEVLDFDLAVNEGEVPADQVDSGANEAILSCRDRLVDDDVNLAAYNTEASANDADAIRAALGYDTWNVLGVSYGTRLAQTYMRLYPESLRSVILDSVLPVEADPVSEIPASLQRSLFLVLTACQQDAQCAATYPNFGSDLVTLSQRLASQPAEIQVTDVSGETYNFLVTDRGFSGLLSSALYGKVLFSSLPELVSDALAGDYTLIERMYQVSLVQDDLVSTGMQYSVLCHDEVPFESAATYLENFPTEPPLNVLTPAAQEFNLFSVCADWSDGSAPAAENEPVVSDVPTLVLTGTFDPVTPPAFAELVAGHLENSYLYEFPTEGHAVVRNWCGTAIAAAFVANPSKEPDPACIGELSSPQFVLGDTVGDTTMIDFELTTPTRLAGVRPRDWTVGGLGVFARQSSLADPTALVVQSTNGAPPATLVNVVGSQIGTSLEPADATRVGDESWETYTALSDQASPTGQTEVLMMFSPVDDVFIVMVALPNQFDQLVEQVAVPVAASLKVG